MRAFTLGHPGGYEKAIRMPGNAKAPGGYAFKTRADAEYYVLNSKDPKVKQYRVYEMELPGTYEECTTSDFTVAAKARHTWHQFDDGSGRPGYAAVEFMPACGICKPVALDKPLDCRLLVFEAPLVHPDVKPEPRVVPYTPGGTCEPHHDAGHEFSDNVCRFCGVSYEVWAMGVMPK